ncbi:MAG: cytochrome c3 family protein [Desulfobacteraceae bacterium]|nr:cytochrome c3 family protein [Desulfobacteraceae bacterium]
MKDNINISGIIIICSIFICMLSTTLFAQNDKSDNKTQDPMLAIFSNQKRPAADFDHSLHEDSLGETGCAKCHHILDADKNTLVYSEGEEAACYDCHSSKPDGNVLALREANHASCTQCHRTLKKERKPAGPTTCGECHKK